MNSNFYLLAKGLISSLEKENLALGLANGKMGLCIYLYQDKSENTREYQRIAEKLLDEIYDGIDTVNTIDIESGLSGIALGINYLIKNNYIEGDINSILKDIDDQIFKQISFGKSNEDITLLIQILYYISVRKQSLPKESNILFNELIIQIINTLHSKIEYILTENVIRFDIGDRLSLFLFVLSEIYRLNVYNHKIIKIVQEITPFILSKYTYYHSKRFQLLWGISKINTCIRDNRLTGFCNLLASQIDLDTIIDEFRNKNIFLRYGISGLCLLMSTYDESEKLNFDIKDFYNKSIEKIGNSLVWKLCDNSDYINKYIGLEGYCGAKIIYNIMNQRL